MFSLSSTDFELFNLPVQFAQERAVLDARWKQLQREAHPDKFAAHGESSQRVAMQWSVRINEAYQRLKDPIRRAGYLCEQHGVPVNAETSTTMPTEFLTKQIVWRESLDEAVSVADIEEIRLEVNADRRDQLSKLERLIDDAGDFQAAAQQVRSLMFVGRFAADIQARLEALDIHEVKNN